MGRTRGYDNTYLLARMNDVDARRQLGDVCIFTARALHYLDRR